MRELNGKGVVLSGAVNGIGRAIGAGGVSEGLKVALADIYRAPLAKKETERKTLCRIVLGVRVNVS